jgi:hypothetical protein
LPIADPPHKLPSCRPISPNNSPAPSQRTFWKSSKPWKHLAAPVALAKENSGVKVTHEKNKAKLQPEAH